MDTASQILFDSMKPNGMSRELVQRCNWEEVWNKACDHCLAPYLHYRLTESDLIAEVPQPIAESFSRAALNNAKRNRQILVGLRGLLIELEGNHIPILVSKGLPVSHPYFGDLGLPVHDSIDLQIKGNDKSAALQILLRIGYVPLFSKSQFQGEQCFFWQPTSYCRDSESVFDPEAPCVIALHTKPWEPRWHGFELDCNLNLWNDARIRNVEGVHIRVPREEKLLVHLAVQYACNVLETNARLMHLLDLILLLRIKGEELCWDLILDYIYSSRAASFCFLAFDLIRRAGDIHLPDSFWATLQSLIPNRIVRWLENRRIDDAGCMDPHYAKRSHICLLYWNMASEWKERARVFHYWLRTPSSERAHLTHWMSRGSGMIRRAQNLTKALQHHRELNPRNPDHNKHPH